MLEQKKNKRMIDEVQLETGLLMESKAEEFYSEATGLLDSESTNLLIDGVMLIHTEEVIRW